MTVAHTHAVHEDSTVTIRVSLKLHGNRDIVMVLNMLERLISHNTLSIFHKDCCVLRGLDGRARVPAELVPKRIVRLLSHWNTSTVAFVADNFMTSSLGFMNHFHCA